MVSCMFVTEVRELAKSKDGVTMTSNSLVTLAALWPTDTSGGPPAAKYVDDPPIAIAGVALLLALLRQSGCVPEKVRG